MELHIWVIVTRPSSPKGSCSLSQTGPIFKDALIAHRLVRRNFVDWNRTVHRPKAWGKSWIHQRNVNGVLVFEKTKLWRLQARQRKLLGVCNWPCRAHFYWIIFNIELIIFLRRPKSQEFVERNEQDWRKNYNPCLSELYEREHFSLCRALQVGLLCKLH